ncbi:MAG TPA: LrgB family protein [Negativicutes bacterium]
MEYLLTGLMLILTLGAYLFSRYLGTKYRNPLLNVVVVSAALVITVLLIFHVPYAIYQPGKEFVTILLGPVTICLAVPLYNHRALVKKHWLPIAMGVCLASSIGVISVMSIAQMAGLPRDMVISLGSKSVTAPVAAEVATVNGGDPGLAIAFVIVTGTLGSIAGPAILTFLKVTSPIIRGLALGSVSHGQGMAIALLEGEQQGIMAGIGMALSAVITSTLIPLLLPIIFSF